METSFRLFNSLSGKLEPLLLRVPSTLSWYACGPTVYDDAHIGHARTYISHDIIRRILINYQDESRFTINFQMGITDIDDKIAKKAMGTDQSIQQISRKYEASFIDSLLRLNVSLPSRFSRVSDNIDNIIGFIQKLIDTGIAYQSSMGNIYFSIERFRESGMRYPRMCQSQVNPNAEDTFLDKEHPQDFALWKVLKGGNGPGWAAFGSKGRPGWHIECSANIAAGFPGGVLDLHTGGIDLKFPHHVNEIAQSEAYLQRDDWCTAFLHFGHIYAGKEKMSKSLGNFVSVNEFLSKEEPDVLRMVCLKRRYADNFEFTDSLVEEAKSTLSRLSAFKANVELWVASLTDQYASKFTEDDLLLQDQIARFQQATIEAARDNFDFPLVLKIVMDQVALTESYYKKNTLKSHPLLLYQSLQSVMKTCQTILGLTLKQETLTGKRLEMLDKLIQFRGQIRQLALQEMYRDILGSCDAVRDDLKKDGLLISDTKDHSTWKFT